MSDSCSAVIPDLAFGLSGLLGKSQDRIKRRKSGIVLHSSAASSGNRLASATEKPPYRITQGDAAFIGHAVPDRQAAELARVHYRIRDVMLNSSERCSTVPL